MILHVAILMAGSWSYGGFMAEPDAAPPPRVPTPNVPIIPDKPAGQPAVEPTSLVVPVPVPRPAPVGASWQADASGYYWVRRPDRSFAGDLNPSLVRAFGEPVNPGELPRYSPPSVPAADVSAVRYRATPVRYCTTGTCR